MALPHRERPPVRSSAVRLRARALMDQPTKSYIGALLCLGTAAGLVTQLALDRFLNLGVVGVGSLTSSIAVVVGLIGLSLLLVYDHEQQQYAQER